MRSQRPLLLPVTNGDVYAECFISTGENSKMARGTWAHAAPPWRAVQEPVRCHFKCRVWEREWVWQALQRKEVLECEHTVVFSLRSFKLAIEHIAEV